MKYILPILLALGCEQTPQAEPTGTNAPACHFDFKPTNIFCTGQFGEDCFVCYGTAVAGTECRHFHKSRCQKRP